jgi:hypothetical protein
MTTQPTTTENSKKCAFPPCNNTISASKNNKKYCSEGCRNKHGHQNRMVQTQTVITPGTTPLPFDKPAPKAEITAPKGVDFHVQYVFDAQKKEIERFENFYKEEREKRKKLFEEKEKLAKELQDLKTDLRIAEAGKPNGLSGFMENPFIKELAPHMGPVLAGIVAKALSPAAPPMVVDGVPDETAMWVNAQPAEVQSALRQLIHEIAKFGKPENILHVIDRMKNIIAKNQPFNAGNNNTSGTQVNNGPMKSSAAFGI